MSWIEKLYETYQNCSEALQFEDDPLPPVATSVQQTHIVVRLDEAGYFRGAQYLLNEATLIPATELSANRSGKDPQPHPLIDKLCYCAKDFTKWTDEEGRFEGYYQLLEQWCSSPSAHPKARAVLRYVQNGTLINDLIMHGVLFLDEKQKIRTTVPKALAQRKGNQREFSVRWSVEIPGDKCPNTWEDEALFQSWISFESTWNANSRQNGNSHSPTIGICMATGHSDVRLALMHPRGIRFGGDTAKLISGNDEEGFTFRGRFRDPADACSVSFEVSQKAHSALRWVITRQKLKERRPEQIYVAFPTSFRPVPDLLKNTLQLFADAALDDSQEAGYQGDAGQLYSIRLNRMIHGYTATLDENEPVIVLGMDSASKGRMAVTFYRELGRSDFLSRIQAWHAGLSWNHVHVQQDESGGSVIRHYIGAPAPPEIAAVVYGALKEGESRKKLVQTTVKRLLVCIVDGCPIPRDLVDSCVRRVFQTATTRKRKCRPEENTKYWEWEKSLGIACSLYKGQHRKEEYRMALEEDRSSPDYLYGRMLAIANDIEELALVVAEENRDTNAMRLMQRFADHPFSTWRTIELALVPYKARLRGTRLEALKKRERILDTIAAMFDPDEFAKERRLSGEFLLGFHCQRAALRRGTESPNPSQTKASDNSGEKNDNTAEQN